MKRLILTLLLAASVAACSPPPPPCASDDGSGPIPCRWDASIQGNGKGTSFTVLAPGVFVYDKEG